MSILPKQRRKSKAQRRFEETAMLLNRLALIEKLAAQPGPDEPLIDRVAAMLRKNRNSQPIPFDGNAPAGSGDESSEVARLGLPVEW